MEQALEKAGAEDEKVSSLAKKNGAIAAYNAGNAQRKSGANEDALALYEKGVALNPDNSSNYEGIARAQEALGNKLEAVKAYLQSAEKGIAEDKADRAEKRVKQAQNIVGKLFVAKTYDQAIEVGEAFLSMKKVLKIPSDLASSKQTVVQIPKTNARNPVGVTKP